MYPHEDARAHVVRDVARPVAGGEHGILKAPFVLGSVRQQNLAQRGTIGTVRSDASVFNRGMWICRPGRSTVEG